VYTAVIICEDYVKGCYKTAVCKRGQPRRMFMLVKVHRSLRRSAPRTQKLNRKWKCYSQPSFCLLSSEGGRHWNLSISNVDESQWKRKYLKSNIGNGCMVVHFLYRHCSKRFVTNNNNNNNNNNLEDSGVDGG